jgi:DNA repair exonuclease SbcCD ATPase subunit
MSDYNDERDEFAEELADLTSARITDAVDRIADAICRIALSPKAIAPAQKKLDKLERKQAAIAKENAEREAALDERDAELAQRAAELDERARALDARATAVENSLQEARDELHNYYRHVEEEDKRLRYRVMAHADLLSNYNPTLQDLPTWPQIRRLVAGLPDRRWRGRWGHA